MRVRNVLMAAAVAAGLGLASVAMADTVQFKAYGANNGGNGGGEFVFTVVTPTPTDLDRIVRTPVASQDFLTFCVEHDETINGPGATQYTAVINGTAAGSYALKGGPANVGSGANGTSDPISTATATLYHWYAVDPTVLPYYSSTAPATFEGAVQLAIWSLEGETSAPAPNDLAKALKAWAATPILTNYVNGPGDSLADGTFAGKNNGTIQDVRVLNLYYDAAKTSFAQDQLVRVTSDAATPIPAAAWMGLVLLGGVVGVRVRRYRQAD